ncbi:MAG: phosphoenolpyruvate synthase, partial [Deltaproteobacteria bacterium]|nr:phosphoenolpyruvate synthase [Deltaproteobacteria bacterium]
MKLLERVSTGLKGLDEIVDNLRIGDNVVWRVGDIEEYAYFVKSYVNKAVKDNRRVVYMRFADHKPLVKQHSNVVIYKLDAEGGFESFSTEVHNIVTKEGKGVFYVFDCLSDLLSTWSTDLMIGNFFIITCPYLFEMDTVAYFAIIRDRHSYQTIARIRETTQLLIDAYRDNGFFHVHPLKVWQRYSPTMFLPHLQEGDQFVPIVNSIDAARLFSHISRQTLERAKRKLDNWDRLFLRAQELLDQPWESEEKQDMIDKICRIMITREPRMSILVKDKFSLEDLLRIRERLIGTGFIGGKAVGMLLARKILSEDTSFKWNEVLEPHDSFYIGSDVFYTYIVHNGWWKLRMKQKTKDGYFEVAKALRENMFNGSFLEEIKEQFLEVVEYFGQSPYIVRSSSLLEDAFGNAFAGKYESVFCVNQGSPEERYKQFEDAVRQIYASTLNEDALMYRLQRGLEDEDEQMALLVQRVSGSYRKQYT